MAPVQSSFLGRQVAVAPCVAPKSFRGRNMGVKVVNGNKATGGPFAPIVVATRTMVGQKSFNKVRGKAISLHSQVIKDFCVEIGASSKLAQQVIRLAKKNGEKLGFLA
eukprot:TRINITY_DN187_c0_g1_i1.p3 TRINITY_DN187_c0_g1~~TRINITY_DN187_c0_g1_i1.p3  ORF type:complete len:108 (+),score=11.48 TRINITY_DN187_c0_g1_i1:141-464(+)